MRLDELALCEPCRQFQTVYVLGNGLQKLLLIFDLFDKPVRDSGQAFGREQLLGELIEGFRVALEEADLED